MKNKNWLFVSLEWLAIFLWFPLFGIFLKYYFPSFAAFIFSGTSAIFLVLLTFGSKLIHGYNFLSYYTAIAYDFLRENSQKMKIYELVSINTLGILFWVGETETIKSFYKKIYYNER